MKQIKFFASIFLFIALFGVTNLSAQPWNESATAIFPTILSKNVGVGIANPTAKLSVLGNNVPTVGIQNTTTDYARIRLSNANAGFWDIAGLVGTTDANDRLNFYNNAAGNVLSLTGSGKVGVNTVSPSAKFQVNTADGIAIGFGDGGTGEGIGSKRTTGGNTYGLDFYTNSINRLSITNSGNVGVGNSSPTAKLSVVGNNAPTMELRNTTTDFARIRLANTNTGFWDIAGVVGATDADDRLNFFHNAAGNILSITGTGNVGIGTTTPGAKLQATSNGTSVWGVSTGNNGNGSIFEANTGENAYGVWGKSSSGFAGYFSGKVHVTGELTWNSDIKLKENIRPITNALESIQRIEPSTYVFKTKDYPGMNFPDSKQYGFIAQNIESVFPEMVSTVTDKSTEPSTDFKAVNYIAMIPVLTQGIREQQEQIQQLQKKVSEKEAELANANNLIETLSNRLSNIEATLGIIPEREATEPKFLAVIATISPNPTAGLVTIELSNVSAAKSIVVNIMDSAGRQVATRTLSVGTSKIQFDLSQFATGIYVAQIMADGKMVSSNKVQLVR